MAALRREQVAAVFDRFGDQKVNRAEMPLRLQQRDRDKNLRVLPVVDYADLLVASTKECVLRGLLGAGEMSCWFGAPGSGKSVLAEDIALHVAAGREWQGRTVKQGAVLYVALERAGVVARRGIAFGAEHGLAGTGLPFSLLGGPLDFRDAATATNIIATMQSLVQRHRQKCPEFALPRAGEIGPTRLEPRLIVIDTVSRALSGGDENSPKDMGALIATLSRIQAALPTVHIMLVHHTPADGQERLRGHSALLGALDVAVHVAKVDASLRTAELVKASDFDDQQRIAFSLKSVTIGQDEQGDAVSAPVVIDCAPPPASVTTKRRKLPAAARVALAALHEAVDNLGQTPAASNYIPPTVKVVTVEQWRDYAYRQGVSRSKEKRARELAFERASGVLLGEKAVAIWEPYVWPVW